MDTITFILILLLVAIMYFGIQYFDSEKPKNTKEYLKNYFSSISKESVNLSDTEIKIISLIIGTFLGLSSAYIFGENIYHVGSSYSSKRVFYETKYFETTYDYTLGFGILIITSGLAYIILKRIK